MLSLLNLLFGFLFKFFFKKPHHVLPAASRSANSTGEERGGGGQALESGRSSGDGSPPGKEDRNHCGICMEDKHSSERIPMRGCGHAYCAQCVGQYVAAKLEANEVAIGCPEPKCGAGRVEPEMCRLILAAETLGRWADRLCEEGIPGPARFYCPYRECGALLIHEEGGQEVDVLLMPLATCPHCKRWVCRRCRVAWHRGLTCEQHRVMAAEEELADGKLLELAKNQKWQQCPGCGFVIEKRSGCDHIRCRCRKEFCYNCAFPLDQTHACLLCRTLYY